MGFFQRIVSAFAGERTPGVVLKETAINSLITPSTHNYTACTYSTKYRAWVRTCRDCGRVITC